MFQLEVDFIMLEKEFKTLAEIKPWVEIALNAGAFSVAIFCQGRVIEEVSI
ncbi:MAG: hypothetical protein ACW99F_17205 [Candidatus Hodarchaeales archaeon]|jgi:hypothetical protein